VTKGVRPIAQHILDSLDLPATIANARGDYLAANALGRAVFAPLFESSHGPNAARFMFLDPVARTFWSDWERAARDLAGTLRSAAGSNPHDRCLSDLIGELSTRSEEFVTLWAAHNVRYHQTGIKRLCHPVVGELELSYEMVTFAADQLPMAIFTAEPGSRSAENLALLGTWVATLEREPA
jgi:hypothetical protein